MNDTIGKIRDFARDQIREHAGRALSGDDKREAVIRRVAEWCDDQLRWPNTPAGAVAEALDGPVIRLVVGALVQAEYDHLRASGALGSPASGR